MGSWAQRCGILVCMCHNFWRQIRPIFEHILWMNDILWCTMYGTGVCMFGCRVGCLGWGRSWPCQLFRLLVWMLRMRPRAHTSPFLDGNIGCKLLRTVSHCIPAAFFDMFGLWPSCHRLLHTISAIWSCYGPPRPWWQIIPLLLHFLAPTKRNKSGALFVFQHDSGKTLQMPVFLNLWLARHQILKRENNKNKFRCHISYIF